MRIKNKAISNKQKIRFLLGVFDENDNRTFEEEARATSDANGSRKNRTVQARAVLVEQAVFDRHALGVRGLVEWKATFLSVKSSWGDCVGLLTVRSSRKIRTRTRYIGLLKSRAPVQVAEASSKGHG